jgi:hypothetical protein
VQHGPLAGIHPLRQVARIPSVDDDFDSRPYEGERVLGQVGEEAGFETLFEGTCVYELQIGGEQLRTGSRLQIHHVADSHRPEVPDVVGVRADERNGSDDGDQMSGGHDLTDTIDRTSAIERHKCDRRRRCRAEQVLQLSGAPHELHPEGCRENGKRFQCR